MNTPSTCKYSHVSIQAIRRLQPALTCAGAIRCRLQRRAICAILAVGFGVPLGGCTYSGGELLYFLGFGQGQKVEAGFQLAPGPILILIDDSSQRVDRPRAIRYLFDELAQELLKHEATGKIIPLQTVDHLRQSDPKFDKRGCREVGELVGAELVLWIVFQDFLAEVQIEYAGIAAYFTVTVKVINVLEKQHRSHVRLWPMSPQGHLVTVSLTGSEATIAKSKKAISKELAGRLAVDIAKLFYEYRLDAFEREQ